MFVIMKRAFEEKDIISSFKHILITKGDEIIKTQKSRIQDRSINHEATKRYLSEQNDIDIFTGKVLSSILDSVIHVSSDKLFSDISKLSHSIMGRISEDVNKKFYIVLGGTSDHDSPDRCFSKSNMFLSTILLASNPEMTKYFVDFICDSEMMHGEMDPSVSHFIYIDDASFSGTQIKENIEELSEFINGNSEEEEEYESDVDDEFDDFIVDDDEEDEPSVVEEDDEPDANVHLVVLYINPSTMIKIDKEIRKSFDNVFWYTSGTYQKPVIDKLLSNFDNDDMDKAVTIAKRLTRGRDDIEKYGPMGKSLFYTDLKIADEVSIYPQFILNPILLDGNMDKIFKESLVKGCKLPENKQDEKNIIEGNYCPIPSYKKKEWSEFVEDQMGK